MKNKEVYLDYAATTPVDSKILKAMRPYFTDKFANPSALYKIGVEAKTAIEDSRSKIANYLETQPDTCFFTGSATEANNMALLGAARNYKDKGNHIISLKTEHSSVIKPLQKLEDEGFNVTYLNVDESGFFDMQELKDAITEDTILVSVMYVNNEIGTIQPVADIGREILKWKKENSTKFPLFHSDACQATNYLNLDVRKLHVDLMTLNASKIYGPKGIGLLYKDRDIELESIVYGGGQENGLRSGTENVPAIIGFSEAVEQVQKSKEEESERLYELQQYFYEQLKDTFGNEIELNGPDIDKEKRVVNNLNVTFKGIEGEKLLLYLDAQEIYCATGSACSTNEFQNVSDVVEIIGGNSEESIRFSFGKETNKRRVDYVVKILKKILNRIK